MSSELRSRLEEKSTKELIRILRAHDLDEWLPEVFPIVEAILDERGVDVAAMLAATTAERSAPEEPAEEEEKEEDEDPSDFAVALVVPDPALLPVIQSLLEQSEIEFFIKNEHTQNLFGFGQLGPGFNFIVGPPIVMVERTRLEEVRELLAPLLQETEPGLEPEDDE